MNIISGNCAGAFSGFLAHLAWMETAEKSNGQINLFLHSRNKTNYPGNTYTGYQWVNSCDIQNYGTVLDQNILFNLFEENEYLKKSFPNEYLYFENYPVVFKEYLNSYPEDTLKYDGRGYFKEQYNDIEYLTKTRNALHNQWKKFKFTDQFHKKVKDEESLIENKKVVCLMLRHSEHYIGATKGYKLGGPDVLKNAIQSIKNVIDDYDAVLLNTLVQPFVDEFKKNFGDKCICTERERFPIDIDWVGGRYDSPTMTDEEYRIEYQNAFLDVILASKTNLVIGGSSNMFLASLCMNPKISFDIFCVADGC
jgi:hypothetical protein